MIDEKKVTIKPQGGQANTPNPLDTNRPSGIVQRGEEVRIEKK